MCLTFILVNQTWDSLCLPLWQKTQLFSLSLISSCLPYILNIVCLCFLYFLVFLLCCYSFFLFCTFLHNSLSLSLVFWFFFLLTSLHFPPWYFFTEWLNLKNCRDISFSTIFYFTRACYNWNQQQASYTLPGELEWIRNICYLPNGESLCVQNWSVYIRIKCRLQFESEPYALPKLWIFIVK